MNISKKNCGELILIRARGDAAGKVDAVVVNQVLPDGKFSAMALSESDGALVPFKKCAWLNVSDFEIVSPHDSIPSNVDPQTGLRKSEL